MPRCNGDQGVDNAPQSYSLLIDRWGGSFIELPLCPLHNLTVKAKIPLPDDQRVEPWLFRKDHELGEVFFE